MQPRITIEAGPFQPRPPQYSPVLEWLRAAGIDTEVIADALGTSPGNIRTIRSRLRHSPKFIPTPLSPELTRFARDLAREPLIQIPSPELCQELGISPEPDEVVLRPAQERDRDELEAEIDSQWARYARQSRFPDGFYTMRSYVSILGQPTSTRLLRILAKTRRYSAWFLIHNGQARSALDQAMRAMALSLRAYGESDDRSHLGHLAESALIASMAHQLCNEPGHSARLLNVAQAACDTARQQDSPEYFRQRGVVHLQLGNDVPARRTFEQAVERMRDSGDVSVATVDMMGPRQMNLLNTPDWDRAQELLANASRQFPPGTLQYSVNATWAAAVGMATGSPQVLSGVEKLLEDAASTAVRFGHQVTRHHLLSITPRLKFKGDLLQRWLRFALYYDALREE